MLYNTEVTIKGGITMSIDYKRFMGLTSPTVSKTDQLLSEAFKKILEVLNCNPDVYVDFYQFISKSKTERLSFGYFWEWMDEKGFDLLKKLDKELPESEEIMDFLNYRNVVLELDQDSGSEDMMIVSISEFFISTSEFMLGFFETAATSILISQSKIPIPENQSKILLNEWLVVESSATDNAGLLLYT